jgi:hypothetical protein
MSALFYCSNQVSADIIRLTGSTSTNVDVKAEAAGLAPTVHLTDPSEKGSAKSATTVGIQKYLPWDPGLSSASISGSARVRVPYNEFGGAFLHKADAAGEAYGAYGVYVPDTKGTYKGFSSASARYVASPGTTFTVRAIWSGDKNSNFAVGINGVYHPLSDGVRKVKLDGVTSLAIASAHSMDLVALASKFEPISLSKSGSGSLRWSFIEWWPGEKPESRIEIPSLEYDNGVTMPENTTGGELTSFPVGEQGIGTDGPLYVTNKYFRFATTARLAAAAVPESSATSTDVQLRYHSDGPLFTHLLVPSSLGSGDSQFELRIGTNVLPVVAGTEVSLLGIAPNGVSEFVLAGIDPGALGTEADPLDVLVGLRFASSGDAALSITVIPEPSSLILASIGSFAAVVMGLRRRRAARCN